MLEESQTCENYNRSTLIVAVLVMLWAGSIWASRNDLTAIQQFLQTTTES